MADNVEIREGVPGDLPGIKRLYPEAFPDENLLPLVVDLLPEEPTNLSLVGTNGSSIISHVIFTPCSVSGTRLKVALLGPLVVAPVWQRQGFGSAIVRNGLQRLKGADVSHVFVLGDPTYYSRLGFLPETNVAPPYPLPTQWRGAWQSLALGNAKPFRPGELSVPQPWRDPALWAP